MVKDQALLAQKIRLSSRVFLGAILVAAALFALAAYLHGIGAARMETLALTQQENDLRDKVSLALGALGPALEDFRAGRKNRDQTIDEIRRIGHSLIYHDERGQNYIFINQQDGLVLVRPFRPQDELRNMWLSTDSNGRFIQQEVSRAAAEHPEGSIVRYEFTNPVTGKEEPKLSWVVLVPELDIHVGTGAYLSSKVKAQIDLARDFFWWGMGLLALLVCPIVILLLFMRHQNSLLNKELSVLADKEAQIAASEEKFRTLFEMVPFGCTLTDMEGRYLMVNSAFCRSTGIEREQAMGATAADLGLMLRDEDNKAIIDAILKEGMIQGREAVLATPADDLLNILYSCTIVAFGGQKTVLTATVDITPIRTTQRALKENEARYRSIFDAAGDAIFILEGDRFFDCNNRTLEMFATTREALEGKSILDYSPLVQPGKGLSSELAADRIKATLAGQSQVFEWTHLKADGSTFEVEVSLNPILIVGRPCIQVLMRDITARKRQEELMRRMNHELESLVSQRTEDLVEVVDKLQDSNRELENTISHLNDTRNQLVQSEKLAALGSLVVGVAHELNTPLGNTLLAASQLKSSFTTLGSLKEGSITLSQFKYHMETGAKLVDIQLASLQRMVDLLGSFRQIDVSRGTEQQRSFELGELVGEVSLTMMIPLQTARIQFKSEIPQGIIMDSYPVTLSQVLVHIINNCMHHAFEGMADPRIMVAASLPANGPGMVELRVTDNGQGMSQEVARRVFDPFFTTKLAQGHNGLGMHLAYNLVTGVLGGTIRVESEPGKGSTWILDLPLKV